MIQPSSTHKNHQRLRSLCLHHQSTHSCQGVRVLCQFGNLEQRLPPGQPGGRQRKLEIYGSPAFLFRKTTQHTMVLWSTISTSRILCQATVLPASSLYLDGDCCLREPGHGSPTLRPKSSRKQDMGISTRWLTESLNDYLATVTTVTI